MTVKAPPKVTSPAFRPTQKMSAVSENVIAPARTSRRPGELSERELERPIQTRTLDQTS